MRDKNTVILIGRREYVDFPDLDIFGIEAKIDTGAYTSAMHCKDIAIKEVAGKSMLCFKVLDDSHPEYTEQEHCFEYFIQKNIKSSSGETELRYVIKTVLIIAGKRIRTAVSLTDRGNMRYPVLIGRKMIRNKFMIDVAKMHTGGILLSK